MLNVVKFKRIKYNQNKTEWSGVIRGKICPECGVESVESSMFCKNCGYQFEK